MLGLPGRILLRRGLNLRRIPRAAGLLTRQHRSFCLPNHDIESLKKKMPFVGPEELNLQTGSAEEQELFGVLASHKPPTEETLTRLDSTFAAYLSSLLEAGRPQDVINIFEGFGAKNFLPGAATEQYLLALMVAPQLKGSTFVPPEGQSGNPIYFIINEKKGRARIFLTLAGICLLLYIIFNIRKSRNNMLGGKETSLVEIPDITLENVKGAYEAKEELADLIDILKNPEKYKNVKIPKGVLLTGPPGTGKTMLARALAGEAGVPFLLAVGSEFEEMFVGLGARRIRKLFEQARENAPCIIFVDEIDAVGSTRAGQSGQMSLNQLLVELDGFSGREGIIFIGATNLSSTLDPALVRPGRFDRIVHIDLPDVGERKEILDYYLAKHITSEDVNVKVLARQTAGMSGADIENFVNFAALEALSTSKNSIDMRNLEAALLSIAMGRERHSVALSEKVKRITAYHEGGHALVALYTPDSPTIRKATIMPRGPALGLVNYLPEEEPMVKKSELLARLMMAMGGRAAEELIFGADQITTGASSDFNAATNIAKSMVTELGMSEKVGHMHINRSGRGSPLHGNQSLIDSEVKVLLEDAYTGATDVLKTHRKELDLLAAALLKYETLDEEEIRMVIAGKQLPDRENEGRTQELIRKQKERRLDKEREFLESLKQEELKKAKHDLSEQAKRIILEDQQQDRQQQL